VLSKQVSDVEVDDDYARDVKVEYTEKEQDDVGDVTHPIREGVADIHMPTTPTDVDADARSYVSVDGEEDEDVDNRGINLPEDFNVVLQWKEIEHVLPSDDSRGLVGDWAALMHRKFHDIFPTCALRFRYNYCRRTNSRKMSSPFWLGKATCRTGNCIAVTMRMPDEPVAGEN